MYRFRHVPPALSLDSGQSPAPPLLAPTADASRGFLHPFVEQRRPFILPTPYTARGSKGGNMKVRFQHREERHEEDFKNERGRELQRTADFEKRNPTGDIREEAAIEKIRKEKSRHEEFAQKRKQEEKHKILKLVKRKYELRQAEEERKAREVQLKVEEERRSKAKTLEKKLEQEKTFILLDKKREKELREKEVLLKKLQQERMERDEWLRMREKRLKEEQRKIGQEAEAQRWQALNSMESSERRYHNRRGTSSKPHRPDPSSTKAKGWDSTSSSVKLVEDSRTKELYRPAFTKDMNNLEHSERRKPGRSIRNISSCVSFPRKVVEVAKRTETCCQESGEKGYSSRECARKPRGPDKICRKVTPSDISSRQVVEVDARRSSFGEARAPKICSRSRSVRRSTASVRRRSVSRGSVRARLGPKQDVKSRLGSREDFIMLDQVGKVDWVQEDGK